MVEDWPIFERIVGRISCKILSFSVSRLPTATEYARGVVLLDIFWSRPVFKAGDSSLTSSSDSSFCQPSEDGNGDDIGNDVGISLGKSLKELIIDVPMKQAATRTNIATIHGGILI
jgi:hypothetical protein